MKQDEAIKEELKECTFHPSITKVYRPVPPFKNVITKIPSPTSKAGNNLPMHQRRVSQNDGRKPIAHLNVNLGNGRCEKLVLREGDDPESIARAICKKYGINEDGVKIISGTIKEKLEQLVKSGHTYKI